MRSVLDQVEQVNTKKNAAQAVLPRSADLVVSTQIGVPLVTLYPGRVLVPFENKIHLKKMSLCIRLHLTPQHSQLFSPHANTICVHVPCGEMAFTISRSWKRHTFFRRCSRIHSNFEKCLATTPSFYIAFKKCNLFSFHPCMTLEGEATEAKMRDVWKKYFKHMLGTQNWVSRVNHFQNKTLNLYFYFPFQYVSRDYNT